MSNNKFSFFIGLIGFCLFVLSCPLPFTEKRAKKVLDDEIPSIEIYKPKEGVICGDIVLVEGRVIKDTFDNQENPVRYEVTGWNISGDTGIDENDEFSFYFPTTTLSLSFTLKISVTDWNENINTLNLPLKRDDNNGIPSLKAISGNKRITLKWDAVPLLVEPPESAYTITINNNIFKPESFDKNIQEVTIPDLENGSLYSFILSANIQLPSGQRITSTSKAVEAIPLSKQTLIPKVLGKYDKIKLEWNSISSTNNFRILRSSDPDTGFIPIAWPISGTTFPDESVSFNTLYYYKIQPLLNNMAIDIISHSSCGQEYNFPWEVPYEIGICNQLKYACDVFISEDYAYIAGQCYGLMIVNISDPQNLDVIYFNKNIKPSCIYVVESFLYLIDINNGFLIMDISDPKKSEIVGSFNYKDYIPNCNLCFNIHVDNDYVYIADYTKGIIKIKISEPDSISENDISIIEDTEKSFDICVINTDTYKYAYVLCKSGLKILDINGFKPLIDVPIDFYNSRPLNLYISDNKAYIVNNKGLFIIYIDDQTGFISKIEDPIHIQITGANDVDVYNNYAYVTYVDPESSGLQVIDISDPDKSVTCYTPSDAISVFVKDNYAYIGTESTGLRIFDLSKPIKSLNTEDYYSFPCQAIDHYVSGPYAYVVDNGSGVKILNIENPENPIEIEPNNQLLNMPNDINSIHISGPYIYIAYENSYLRILDISEPENPKLTGYLNLSSAKEIFVSGSYAYIIIGDNKLKIIDISDPKVPEEAAKGNIESLNNAKTVSVVGSYAYIIEGSNGLRIINTSNPKELDKTFHLENPNDIYIEGSLAYIAAGNSGLYIINIENQADPFEVNNFTYSNARNAKGIFLAGSHVYIADGEYGLKIIDVLYPGDPKLIAHYENIGDCTDVQVVGSYAYIATSSGLKIIDIKAK